MHLARRQSFKPKDSMKKGRQKLRWLDALLTFKGRMLHIYLAACIPWWPNVTC